MGRTVPTYAEQVREIEAKWAKFRRALRREDQLHFDRLLRSVRYYSASATYQCSDDPRERSRSVRERRGESARRSQSRLRTSSRSDDPTSTIPTWSSGSRPALRLPKSAGKPATGQDHAAIPTIRLSVGRRASELNQRG
jgi:hypothetical protein